MGGGTDACFQGLKRTVCVEASAAGKSESVCEPFCGSRASINRRSQRCPELLLHQSDAYSDISRRRSRSQAGGTQQLGDGCQPGPWHHLCSETTQACSHTPACYLPLELFRTWICLLLTNHNIPAPVWCQATALEYPRTCSFAVNNSSPAFCFLTQIHH